MPMTKKQYREYCERVESFMKSEGINGFSPPQIEGEEERAIESFFSWRSCECCKCPEGGMRQDVISFSEVDNKIHEYVICEDCIYYTEYGQLDDTTMMNMVDCDRTEIDKVQHSVREMMLNLAHGGWRDDINLSRLIPYAALYYTGAKSIEWLKSNLGLDNTATITALR